MDTAYLAASVLELSLLGRRVDPWFFLEDRFPLS